MSGELRTQSGAEERVVEAVRRRDELVGIVADLVVSTPRLACRAIRPARSGRCRSTCAAPWPGSAPSTDLWEPEPVPAGHPILPNGLDFRGRPQLAARLGRRRQRAGAYC